MSHESFKNTAVHTAIRSLVAAAALTSACQLAVAGALDGPGAVGNVGPSDPVENWTVTNGATLNVLPGGAATQIEAISSTVNITGGRITAGSNSNFALDYKNSAGTITGAEIRNDNVGVTRYALSASTANLGQPGSSVVTVRDSLLTSFGRGVLVTRGSSLTLSGTQVIGRDAGGSNVLAGGLGASFFGGNILATNNSSIIGDRNGVLISDEGFGTVGDHTTLELHGSTIHGINGSAIRVETALLTRPTRASADILISEGSTLIGGNGTILEVLGESSVNFTVDRSTLTGNVVVAGDSSANIALRNSASLTGNLTGISSLSLDASTVTGNVTGKADGSTSVLLSNSSVLQGQLDNVGSLGVNSGATWRMTGSGSLPNLAMNGGSVAISDGSGSQFNTLTVQNLSGNGTFLMGADLNALRGDMLVVTSSATGNHQLNIRNTGANPENPNSLKMVETAGGDASFDVVGGAVDVGTYQYLLDKQGDDWYLVGTTRVSPSAATVIGLHSTAPTVWYGEAASLRSRMGDLRLGNVEAGAWARTYGRGYRVGAGAGQAYDQKQSGVSVGMDRRVPVADGQLLVGGFGGYSTSDLDFDLGSSGKVDSYYLGAYATWMREDGYYLDGLIKFNRFKNTAEAVMSDGVHASGDYRSYGWGGQIEAGRYIALPESNWFIEPYVQLSAVRAGGKDYWLNNGMHAENADMNSILGRVGATLGLDYKTAAGSAIRPYVKFAVAHEFAKSNKVFVNGNQFNNDLSGTRAEVGLGIAAQLTPALQLHGDLDYASGKNFKQKWGANIGLRYAF